MKRLFVSLTFIALLTAMSATSSWTTHFAYTSVDKIAAGGGIVYGVSSGALFSIDAQTDKIRTYSNQDGMHGSNIVCIQWMEPVQALMIMYADGKMDLLREEQFQFVPDLYLKDVTFSKQCNAVVIKDSLAYMAMNYGVQTFHIRKQEFVDTYFIGDNAKEVPVSSVAFSGNNIYAASDTILYTASLDDNIVDYAYWSIVPLPVNGTIQGLVTAQGTLYLLQKNTCYRLQDDQWVAIDNQSYKVLNVVDGNLLPGNYPVVSENGLWAAAGEQGIIRELPTGEQITYQLNGPLNNTPYRLSFQQGQLFMLAGGRWGTQYNRPGSVMRFDGTTWHNITKKDIVNAVGGYCYDMMNVAVDPMDQTHYYTTSYGTGMYEFRNDTCIKRWDTSNSIIGTSAINNPARYTRTDAATYDAQGNLWVMNAGDVPYNIVIFTPDSTQIGMNINNSTGARELIHTVGQLIFDKRDPNLVWVLSPRNGEGHAGVGLIDTKGTINNPEDDRSLIRTSWIDSDEQPFIRQAIYTMRQDSEANIWLATGNGIFIIPSTTDYFQSEQCEILHLKDNDGTPLFEEEEINDVVFDQLNRPWIATQNSGVYVFASDLQSVVAHYSMDNSALPSNTIFSFAYDKASERMYIGSAAGLVSCKEPTSDIPSSGNDNSSVDYGSMQQWTTHFAYTSVRSMQLSSTHVYALSEGSLFAVDRADESLVYYSKLDGLNGSVIQRIDYDNYTRRLVITYEDGMIDLLDENEVTHPVADLYLKQMNALKRVQDIAFKDGKAYMAMPFGIMVMNLRKEEISDTYYIGNGGDEMALNAIAIRGDTIYAAADNLLYTAHMHDNLVDYSQWKHRALAKSIKSLVCHNGDLYMLMDSVIYRNSQPIATSEHFAILLESNTALLARTADYRYFEVTGDEVILQEVPSTYKPYTAIKEGGGFWIGMSNGVWYVDVDKSIQKYTPKGPLSNIAYFLTTHGSELWMVPGGRWFASYGRAGQVMRYNGKTWNNLTNTEIKNRLGTDLPIRDIGHIAIDPANPKHFYASCFGTGLLEFLPDGAIKQYTYNNSPLVTLVEGKSAHLYCRTDALTFDADGNLWFTNTGDLATNIHIIDPQNQWHLFNLYQNGRRIILNTVSKFLVDNRYPNYKWIASARLDAGVVLLNDNGTPYNPNDDRILMRTTFVDQDNKSITLARLQTMAQDMNGNLWLGTSEGILIIDAATDFFQSGACRRLKISRHDGTNLADYLLGTEQINSIVFAGGNRIWIGTEASGAYLVHMVTKEGIYEPEILAHFTTINSPMPSDCVLSIAVDDRGEVYIGTAKGLVSYRGDATEPEEEFNGAYVYPNPVRPNYEGAIAITGLMDNTTVFIADAAGNVVCRTHSNGGTAIWDGKTQSGKKAHSGVYTIYCNTADGKGHTVLKLLLMH